MPANIVENMNLILSIPRYQQRFTGDLNRQQVSNGGDLLGSTDTDPSSAQAILELQFQLSRICIAAGRQAFGAFHKAGRMIWRIRGKCIHVFRLIINVMIILIVAVLIYSRLMTQNERQIIKQPAQFQDEFELNT